MNGQRRRAHRARREGGFRFVETIVTVAVLGLFAVAISAALADYDRIVPLCERYDIPIVEDSAEALGATWQGRPAGSFGVIRALSFNGNKFITTSGGGMLLTDDAPTIAHS